MIKKTITFTDYDGNKHTEDFYFNLNKAEITKLQASVPGGWSEFLQRTVNKLDVPVLMKVFDDLIRDSYGVKSDDGRRFIKSKELTDEFMQTEAYSELYSELLTDSEKAAEFFNGIMPKLSPEEEAELKKQQKKLLADGAIKTENN